jgi:NAD-specific glutamate dehydrogenase
MVKDLGHLVYFKKVPMPSSSMASGSGKYGGPPSTKGMFNQQSVLLGLLKANTSRTLKQLRCKASPYRVCNQSRHKKVLQQSNSTVKLVKPFYVRELGANEVEEGIINVNEIIEVGTKTMVLSNSSIESNDTKMEEKKAAVSYDVT